MLACYNALLIPTCSQQEGPGVPFAGGSQMDCRHILRASFDRCSSGVTLDMPELSVSASLGILI